MPSRPVRRAVFPGQFDPITNGHIDVIRRGLKLFDELIVAVGVNPDKKELFTLQERVGLIGELLKDEPAAKVQSYTGLTMDFVESVHATTILRGIRDATDLRYEFNIAMVNRSVGGVETVFVMTADQYALTSSSLIRQVVQMGGDLKKLKPLLPPNVITALAHKARRGDLHRPTGPDTPAT
ncbi:MAG TPA: pantetheine-phosphate adenylyltransferase [Tepidisphaeraceae bacterium]|jgi:pantetheine-phosphate adenylyltransferase